VDGFLLPRKHKKHDLFDAACEAAAVKNPVHVVLERSTGVFANAQRNAQRLRGCALVEAIQCTTDRIIRRACLMRLYPGTVPFVFLGVI
jgi:hypothetical protein